MDDYVADEDDADAVVPVEAVGVAQDVEGGATLVPVHLRLGLQGAVRWNALEAALADH